MSDCSGPGQQVSDFNIRPKIKQDAFPFNSNGWVQTPRRDSLSVLPDPNTQVRSDLVTCNCMWTRQCGRQSKLKQVAMTTSISCNGCHKQFSSKNQLFSHLKLSAKKCLPIEECDYFLTHVISVTRKKTVCYMVMFLERVLKVDNTPLGL